MEKAKVVVELNKYLRSYDQVSWQLVGDTLSKLELESPILFKDERILTKKKTLELHFSIVSPKSVSWKKYVENSSDNVEENFQDFLSRIKLEFNKELKPAMEKWLSLSFKNYRVNSDAQSLKGIKARWEGLLNLNPGVFTFPLIKGGIYLGPFGLNR